MRRGNHQSPRILSHNGKWTLRHIGLAVLGTLALVWTMPAQAGFVSGSYQINIGESGRVLEAMVKEQRGLINHDQFTSIKMEEMWKSPSIRLVDRNRPAIVLQNISDPSTNNEISQFTIDIKQLGYEFGTGDFNLDPFAGSLTLLTKYSDPGVTLSSSYGTVSDVDSTIDRTKLVLNIGGLTPGRSLIFRVDLDPTPMTSVAYPDFQYVLLGADIENGQGPATPAEISALFASGSMTTVTAPMDFAPGMGQTFPSAGLLEPYHSQSNSSLYQQTGGTEIPEPSTALLLLAGLAGLSRYRRRSLQQTACPKMPLAESAMLGAALGRVLAPLVGERTAIIALRSDTRQSASSLRVLAVETIPEKLSIVRKMTKVAILRLPIPLLGMKPATLLLVHATVPAATMRVTRQ